MILAAADQATETSLQIVSMPSHWPAQADLVELCRQMEPGIAVLLILAGLVYLIFGFQIFKILVMLNAAIVGAVSGYLIGRATGLMHPIAGTVVGAVLAAVSTWPLMNYAVAVMGGLYGAILGASLWNIALPTNFAWAGAFIGLVALGLLSFLIFRGCVMMYMSLQGSVMLIIGVMALIAKHPELTDKIVQNMQTHAFIFPLAIFIPTLAGVIYQQIQYPAPAAKKPAGSGGH